MIDFASFDFNNLPDFEPLENTLVLIRENKYNKEDFYKLLDIDTNELLDHPQWTELLDLLKLMLNLNSNSNDLFTLSTEHNVIDLHESLHMSVTFGGVAGRPLRPHPAATAPQM